MKIMMFLLLAGMPAALYAQCPRVAGQWKVDTFNGKSVAGNPELNLGILTIEQKACHFDGRIETPPYKFAGNVDGEITLYRGSSGNCRLFGRVEKHKSREELRIEISKTEGCTDLAKDYHEVRTFIRP
jgi:hypothetical protein